MFFAYNNGITATAEEVQTRRTSGGLELMRLKNFQIVNGGQTTASIYAASRKGTAALGKVFVQMKLSVIPPERSEAVVPKISEYANSQNKVNAADFFANHPFHLRMKEFSERILAPSRDGSFRESKWFYERARGQYQDARGNRTVAEQRRFDLEYPKQQVFTKTDLAKFLSVWNGVPDVVSRGAQKNFAHFAEHVGKAWAAEPDVFNEAFYRHAVAKAIVFRTTEDLVTKQSWYQGGYRANIVAYAIAKLAHDVEQRGSSVNFDAIWRTQAVSPNLHHALVLSAESVKDVIIDPPTGVKNVTEWAKRQACWSRVASLQIAWPRSFLDELLTGSEQRSLARDAVKEQRVLNGIEAQSAVVRAGGGTWREVRRWGTERRLLSEKEMEILDVAAAIPRKLPTEKQSMVVLRVLMKLRAEGCTLASDISIIN
jgi:hypothetical protein